MFVAKKTALIASSEVNAERHGLARLFRRRAVVWLSDLINKWRLLPMCHHYPERWQMVRANRADSSKGTKVFALTGKIQHTGLIEVPWALRCAKLFMTLVAAFLMAGNLKRSRRCPSGGCIPEQLLDTLWIMSP